METLKECKMNSTDLKLSITITILSIAEYISLYAG